MRLTNKKSNRVKLHPPIQIDPAKTMPGSPVWCANSSVDEYWRKKEERRTEK